MVASIAPHRDEFGLGDGLMLIDGRWVAVAEESWSHRHRATVEQVASFPAAGSADVDLAVRAARRARRAVGAGPDRPPDGGQAVLHRQPGRGAEGHDGRAAIESYTELKTVLLPFTDEMM
jgi:hypothetical protein